MAKYKVYKLSSNSEAILNAVIVHKKLAPIVKITSAHSTIIYNCHEDYEIDKTRALLNNTTRVYLDTGFNDLVTITPVVIEELDRLDSVIVSVVRAKGRPSKEAVRTALIGTYVQRGLTYYVQDKIIHHLKVNADGIIDENTTITITINIATTTNNIKRNNSEIDYYIPPEPLENWDLSNVGGLHYECNEIFRRAFTSRVYGSEYTAKTGMDHVKGIILYGPPGCGKTLIARELSKLITSVEPKVVNGPELFNKYVGESEANVRKLFKDAEDEYRSRGDNSNIHILIFDEFDSIARKRGSASNSQLYDGVVNQILTKMDGKEKLNNIIVVALTNRLDLLDDALLRPGRFEVHIEIGLPSMEDRYEILDIHTKRLKENKSLAEIDEKQLIERMMNFTGAEIASVVRNAVSYATSGMIDIKGTKIVKSEQPLLVTQEHFIHAIDGTVPRFGKKYYQLPEMWEHLRDEAFKMLSNLSESDKKLQRAYVSGKSGSGKTTLVKYLSIQLGKFGYDCVRYTSDYDLIGQSEHLKIQALSDLYDDCLKCQRSILIIDNLEIILGYNAYLRYISNNLFQVLKTILSNNSKAGHLIIMVTMADHEILESLQLSDYFEYSLMLDV